MSEIKASKKPVYQKNDIRPVYTFYHPNQKGNGTAVSVRMFPATVKTVGFMQMEFARQLTVGDAERKVFPTFNWKERIIVRLVPQEVAEMVGVFRGGSESLRDGAGFIHRSDGGAATITMVHVVEPRPSYQLKVRHETLAGEDGEVSIYLAPAEAFTLELALTACMGYLCFGVGAVAAGR